MDTRTKQPGLLMPVEFGSPFEQVEDSPEATLEKANVPRATTTVSVSFLTDPAKLEAMLPPGKGLVLRGDPVMTITGMFDAGDLRLWAGRSYHIVMVTFPVTFHGREREVHGDFSPLILENLADPIIAGRELIGWSKVFADIESPRVVGNGVRCVAGWCGFDFLDFRINELEQLGEEALAERQKTASVSEGSIHYKYIRRTGSPTEADADYLTMSTSRGAPSVDLKHLNVWSGQGQVTFRGGGWRDLPITLIGAVNALAGLEAREVVGAYLTKTDAIASGGMGETVILE